jgi:predicted SprT family Zn-dependent metalloprotease
MQVDIDRSGSVFSSFCALMDEIIQNELCHLASFTQYVAGEIQPHHTFWQNSMEQPHK